MKNSFEENIISNLKKKWTVSTGATKESQQIPSWKSKEGKNEQAQNISNLKSRVNWTLGA